MRRWVVAGVVAAVLVVVGASLALRTLSFEWLRPILERQLSEGFGLEVRLEGDLRPELLPRPHFEAGQIHVSNLPGRPSPHLLTIERLYLDLRLWPLLQRKVSIDTIKIYGAELRIEPDADGNFSFSPRVEELDEAESSGLELHLSRFLVEDARVFYDPVGAGKVTTFSFDVLELKSADLESPLSATMAGDFEGGSFEVEASAGSLVELLQPTRPFPLEIRGRVLGTQLEIDGTLESPTELAGIDLTFWARLDDPAALIPDPDRRPRGLGSVQVSGRIRDPDGTLGVESLRVSTGEDQPFRIALEGSVRDLVGFAGVELQLHAEADSTDLLEALSGTPLPDVPLEADLHFSDEDGSLGTEGEATAGEGPLSLHLLGGSDDLRSLAELDVGLRLRTPELGTLAKGLEIELARPLPPLSPFEFTAKLRDFDGSFGLDEIRATAGHRDGAWVEVTGSVRDVLKLAGVRLAVSFGSDSVQVLEASVGRELPQLGSFSGSLLVSDEDGALGVETAELTLGRAELFELKLSGRFDDLRALDEIEVEASLEARDLVVLGKLADVELPSIGPVSYSARIRGSDERLVSKGSLRLNRTVLNGEWILEFAEGQQRSLSGGIRSPHVFLADLGIAPGVERPDLPRRERAASAFAQWWSQGAAAPHELLEDFDLDLVLHADRVSGRRGLQIQDLHAEVRLDDGHLVVEDVTGGYDGGRVEGSLRINSKTEPPVHVLQLEAFNVDATKLVAQIRDDIERAGKLDLSVGLTSRGRTRTQMTKSLSGFFGAMLRKGALVDRYSRAFSMSFLRVSVPELRRGQDAETSIKCLVAFLPVEAGVVELERLYLEGDAITVDGSGTIDLGGNEIDVRLAPHLHRPGLVSVAVTVDISGPLNNPRMKPVRRSLGASMVRGLVSNALRPSKGVMGRLRRGEEQKEEDPCDVLQLERDQERETLEMETDGAAFR